MVVVNQKVPRLFFAGDIGYIQCLQVRYASKFKVRKERIKRKIWKGFVSHFWDLNQSLRLQNNL